VMQTQLNLPGLAMVAIAVILLVGLIHFWS
jgi:hypothetical protein